jgi:hypothetical protein
VLGCKEVCAAVNICLFAKKCLLIPVSGWIGGEQHITVFLFRIVYSLIKLFVHTKGDGDHQVKLGKFVFRGFFGLASLFPALPQMSPASKKRGRGQQMPSQCRAEEETLRRSGRKRGGRCNTRSTFETYRRNTCNISLKADEMLERCI